MSNKPIEFDFEECFAAIDAARTLLIRHPEPTVKTVSAGDGLAMVETFLVRHQMNQRKIADLVKAAKAVAKMK